MNRRLTTILLAALLVSAGCETSGQTGALAGAGIGALAGQAIGGDTGATLVGAGVGAGIGYIIGNEKDKKKAREMNARNEDSTHTEVGPLGGTRWTVVSISPANRFGPAKSRVIYFNRTGRVTTTKTFEDGAVVTATENYRVVGSTLVINQPGYLINARFSIQGDQLILDAEDFSAVLKRL